MKSLWNWLSAMVLVFGLVSCTSTSPGRIEVEILGLPPGVNASVSLAGLGTLTASGNFEGVAPGTYAVVAYDVLGGNATYRPTVSAATITVTAGQTSQVDVSYAAQAGSSASSTINVATGGTVSLGAATLSIPPGAFEGSTTVSVTLTSQGIPQSTDPGDPLGYVSTAYSVSAVAPGANGAAARPVRIDLDTPPSLSILPNASALEGTQTLMVGSRDPQRPNLVSIHRPEQASAGPAFTPISYPYTELGNWQWIIRVPLYQRPTQGAVLQVPWYYQSGIPWCAPTSLTEMLRYYDFTETGVDPLNASFGASTALANWQLARAQMQPRDAGGGWPFDQIGLAGKYTIYAWDADDLLDTAGTRGGYQDFMVYTTLVNTGLFGLFERRPMVMGVDYWWHSVTVVGVDGTGLYYHDSNGAIALKTTWEQFQTDAKGWKNDKDGNPQYKELIFTGVLNLNAPGITIKNENRRRGSLVISRGDVTFRDMQENTATLEWDGANPHMYGYYFNSPSAVPNAQLGAYAMPGGPLHYAFRVTNVSNVALPYSADVTLADLDGNPIGSPASFNVTVNPYTLSAYSTGTFTLGSRTASPAPGMVRFRLFQGGVLQDVKYIRFNWPVVIK